jgi:DNA replication protein DnaC
MDFTIPGVNLEEAGKRVQAKIYEVGEEEYYRQLIERQRKEDEEFLVNDFKRATSFMLGEQFKDCTFDNLRESYDSQRGFDNRAAKEAAKRFAKDYKGKGLLFSGPNGIGKNHLAAAIVSELSKRYVSAYFGSITKIKTKICDAFDTGVEDAIQTLLGYDVVVINDLGAEKDTDWTLEFLFDFVDRIYESKKPIVITTNLDADSLFKRYGSRIVSRILGMCEVVKYKDYDHRLKERR